MTGSPPAPLRPDFLWGAASAAHQIEGGNVNADMWAAEHAPDSIFHEPSGDACDGYHRYREDIGLLAEAGLNSYRFSVEWARIEPEDGWFSRAALDHYRRVAATCHEHGITPFVTLHHFTAPRWFARRGGWRTPDAASRFARYAATVATSLAGLVEWVCTVNEANLFAMFVASGGAPLGTGSEGPTIGSPETPMAWLSPDLAVMAEAHRRARDEVKGIDDRTKVGWSLALVDLQSVAGGEERCSQLRQVTQLDWLGESSDDDYVGVQTYSRERVGADGVVGPPQDASVMQTGWEVYPEALEHTVRLAAETARVPVVVTENGMATDDDEERIGYSEAALAGLGRCVADGIDLRGYLHWTLLDNFEWMSGYSKTFGLVAVDRTTFARAVKPSLRWLGDQARANRLPTREGSG